MPANPDDAPDRGRYLTEPELAARWRMRLRTLQSWRREGYAPAYLTLGRSTIYPLEEVEKFEAERLRPEGGAE